MNVERLRRLAAHLRNLPENQRFDQSCLGISVRNRREGDPVSPLGSVFVPMSESVGCGTPACAAGHAVALFDPEYAFGGDISVMSRAAQLLEIGFETQIKLFTSGYLDSDGNPTPAGGYPVGEIRVVKNVVEYLSGLSSSELDVVREIAEYARHYAEERDAAGTHRSLYTIRTFSDMLESFADQAQSRSINEKILGTPAKIPGDSPRAVPEDSVRTVLEAYQHALSIAGEVLDFEGEGRILSEPEPSILSACSYARRRSACTSAFIARTYTPSREKTRNNSKLA